MSDELKEQMIKNNKAMMANIQKTAEISIMYLKALGMAIDTTLRLSTSLILDQIEKEIDE